MLELTTIQKIVLAVAALVLGSSGAYIFMTRGQTAPPAASVYVPPLAEQQTTYVVVYIVGAVRNPGLYQVPAGTRVYQAIEQAGGFTDDADRESVNLAQVVKDAQKIMVATKAAEPAAPVEAVSPSPVTPQPASSAPTPADVGPAAPPQQYPSPPPEVYTPPTGQPVLVNLNTATQEQLEQIPGIGPVRAQRILGYRAQYGVFRRVEELMLIEGIGLKKMEQIRPYVVLYY